ncbi:AN1-type zinc finger domain-containing protein, partial [Thermoproteota archaeon]
MEQLDTCEVCGKNTKFMFVCPHCKKSLCIEHRKQENHNCENLVEEKISPSDEENLGLSEVHNFIYDSDNDLPLLEHTENDEEKNINVEEKYDNDLDVVSIQSNEDIKNESKSRRVIKVLAFSILIILTISSILLNGYLYFNIDNSDKKLIESYNVMEERNILMNFISTNLYR